MPSENRHDTLFAWFEQAACRPIAPATKKPCSLPTEELPADLLAIVETLRSRIGIASAMTAQQIAETCSIRPGSPPAARGTYVRSLLARYFRDLPYTLCASPAAGYFRPATPDELAHYRRDLHSRAREILTRLRDLKLQARAEGLL